MSSTLSIINITSFPDRARPYYGSRSLMGIVDSQTAVPTCSSQAQQLKWVNTLMERLALFVGLLFSPLVP